jgi:uncharacterized membrane protein YcaP (DUF421 family)
MFATLKFTVGLILGTIIGTSIYSHNTWLVLCELSALIILFHVLDVSYLNYLYKKYILHR